MRSDPDFAKSRNRKLSESMKRRYRDNPEILERQRELALEASKASLKNRDKLLEISPNFYTDRGKKISESKKLRAKEDPQYRDQLMSKLAKAREAYDLKLIEDPEFALRRAEEFEKLGRGFKGSAWVTNGKENRRIKPEEQIPEGFKKGRTVKKRKRES